MSGGTTRGWSSPIGSEPPSGGGHTPCSPLAAAPPPRLRVLRHPPQRALVWGASPRSLLPQRPVGRVPSRGGQISRRRGVGFRVADAAPTLPTPARATYPRRVRAHPAHPGPHDLPPARSRPPSTGWQPPLAKVRARGPPTLPRVSRLPRITQSIRPSPERCLLVYSAVCPRRTRWVRLRNPASVPFTAPRPCFALGR